MQDIRFDEPVELLTDKPGTLVKVSTAGQAIHALLNDWPVNPGTHHKLACQALFDLFEGRRTPQEAREAFEYAADEAEIRVGGCHAKHPVAMFMSKHRPTRAVAVPRPKKRR